MSGAQRTSAHRVIRSATRAHDRPAGRAPGGFEFFALSLLELALPLLGGSGIAG